MDILCSPHTEDIEKSLMEKDFISQRYLHLTPTMILFRRRIRFYLNMETIKKEIKEKPDVPADMKPEEKVHQFVDIFEINQFVKSLRRTSNVHVLNKAEATVLLERILSANQVTNNPSWSSAMLDIYDLFTQLSLSGLSLTTLRSFDSSSKWQFVLSLYETYLLELKAQDAFDAALLSRKQLETLDVSGYAELILDGAFLPFTPMLQLIIEKFQSQGKRITVYLPFDSDRNDHPALKAITQVYERFKPNTSWISVKEAESDSFFIKRLPKLIFRNEASTHVDPSFQILRFSTVEEELHFIMQTIATLLRHKGTKPEQVVIVTPGAMEIRPLIREISEEYNLRVHLPKRPLLHLNQGRAIKHLFDIRIDTRKEKDTYLTSKIMKVFLNESIVKHTPQILQAFEKIEGFFEDCNSVSDFFVKISQLQKAHELIEPKYDQHPLRTVLPEQLEEIKRIALFLENASAILVNAPDAHIIAHMQRLIAYLKSDSHFRELDDDIWSRLQSILQSTSGQQNLVMTSMEFGERVSALFNEGEEFEPGEQPVEDDTDVELKREILVTGPNNVEFQRYDYVFLCRFTQDVYPEAKRYNWLMSKKIEHAWLQHSTSSPFKDTKALEYFYLDRGMYHIYLALCAPRTQLTISYAQMDNGLPLTPAHYLHDIAKTFGIQEGDRLANKNEPTLEQLLEKHKILKSPSKFIPISSNEPTSPQSWHIAERDFTAEDVAIFYYCPRRFYYQSKHEEQHTFHQLFHLQAYATSCLHEKAVELFVNGESFPITEIIDTSKQLKRLKDVIVRRREEAETSIRPLFPLSLRHWQNVRVQADFHLTTLLDRIFKGDFVKEFRKRGNASISVSMRIASQDDFIQMDDFSFSSIRELEVQYAGRDVHRYSISNKKDILSFSSSDYDEKDSMKEIKDWYLTFKREFKKRTPYVTTALEQVIEAVRTGSYPKKTGGHCKYCSFNTICREREVDSC
ncbi:hypothetical protein [Cohnella sp. GCM10012308]|uniref:hypothetical protein n=1 Tax=Cohnella sp. GCM10012308 TaxID=3317329 RepID=UPI00360C04BD